MKILKSQIGFSLIEIMVVLAIMGLLASIVGSNVMDALRKGRINRVKADFRSIENALLTYRMDNGFYPTSEQGIEALVVKAESHPEPKSFPKDGYLPRLPRDAWKNEYIYLSPGNGHPYEIISLGSDGVEGGEEEDADLSVWDE